MNGPVLDTARRLAALFAQNYSPAVRASEEHDRAAAFAHFNDEFGCDLSDPKIRDAVASGLQMGFMSALRLATNDAPVGHVVAVLAHLTVSVADHDPTAVPS